MDLPKLLVILKSSKKLNEKAFPMDKSGITIQVYYDWNENPADHQIILHPDEKEYSAEDLILQGCKKCGIGPIGFNLFGLVTYSGSKLHWHPPNKKITSTRKVQEFWLRVRFIPSLDGIQSLLLRDGKETVDYFFLQCRYDFVNDQVR